MRYATRSLSFAFRFPRLLNVRVEGCAVEDLKSSVVGVSVRWERGEMRSEERGAFVMMSSAGAGSAKRLRKGEGEGEKGKDRDGGKNEGRCERRA